MTPATATDSSLGRPVSLDDVKHKALALRNEVDLELKRELEDRRTQMMIAGAVVAVAVIGIAYYAGVRAAQRVQRGYGR